MPEIVEVERMARIMRKEWMGKRIAAIYPNCDMKILERLVEPSSFEAFQIKVEGRTIVEVLRKGKNIFLCLDNGSHWRIHLWSTGWFLPNVEKPEGDSSHLHFIHDIFAGGARVYIALEDRDLNRSTWSYFDPRTFGLWVVEKKKPQESQVWRTMGPDWITERKEAEEALMKKETKRDVKSVLRDQTITAGIGSYLACEALFWTSIHPGTEWYAMDMEDRKLLIKWIGTLIDFGLDNPGHDHWYVFQRKGLYCRLCGVGKIVHLVDNGPTYYCSGCQEPRGDLTKSEKYGLYKIAEVVAS